MIKLFLFFILFFILMVKSDSYDLSKREVVGIFASSIFLSFVFLNKLNLLNLIPNMAIAFIVTTLCFVFVIDYKYQEIPDKYVVILTILTIIFTYQQHYGYVFDMQNIYPILSSGIFYALSFGILMFITGGALGAGDVKLAFPIGILLTKTMFFNYIGYTFIIGAVFGIVLVLLKKKKRKDMIAFGPFMIISFFICFLT